MQSGSGCRRMVPSLPSLVFHLRCGRGFHRGKVRTILERGRWLSNRPGIVASERGKLGAWFWGGVFIPQDLPEYERLKETILSWRA